jgi:hypothetical protein
VEIEKERRKRNIFMLLYIFIESGWLVEGIYMKKIEVDLMLAKYTFATFLIGLTNNHGKQQQQLRNCLRRRHQLPLSDGISFVARNFKCKGW